MREVLASIPASKKKTQKPFIQESYIDCLPYASYEK
jgi:hypothetical protein